MLKYFERFINKNNLCNLHDKLLIAVSGGVDSIVLLDLMVKAKYNVAIVHCNFGLRGDESDTDEIFVRQLAKKYNKKLFIKKCNATKYAVQYKVTTQEAARILRYNYFEQLIKKEDFNKVAIGHNSDDNIESFFINLSRSSGLQGLAGIAIQRNHFIRPLMFASRAQIVKYAENQKLLWREDSSNASDKYLRNRIRHHLIPILKNIDDNYVEAIAESMLYLSEAYKLFDQLMQQKKNSLLKTENNMWTLNFEKLIKNENAELLLFYILKDFGFKRKVVSQLFKAGISNVSGKLFFSNNYRLLLNRNRLILSPVTKDEEGLTTITGLEGEIKKPVRLQLSLKHNKTQFDFVNNRNKAWFDAGKLTLPLTVRKWQKGDRFKPFGMKGSMLISDFLINEKLSLFQKEKVHLLISGKTIIWVIGYRSSEHFKIKKDTKTILEVEYFPE